VLAPIGFKNLRLNTIPTFVSWDGDKTFTVGEGVYRFDAHLFLNWDFSVNVRLDSVLEFDNGSGYAAISGSEDSTSILNGTVAAGSLRNAIFFEVPVGQTWNFQLWAAATSDTADYAYYGANFMIERIANGVTC